MHAEVRSPIPGAKILLMGDTGAGKTYSIRTLIDAGITPFIIFSEPGMEVLSDLKGKLHWKYIAPTVSGWDAMQKIGEMVNTLSFEALCKITDTNKSKYTQWIDVVKTNNNFICDCCGIAWGDVQTWGTDRALVMDSLTGFSAMAFKLVIGGKVAKAKPDYQIAQEMVMKVLDAWTTATRCWFVLIAHESREADEATGAIQRMPASVGKAISPDIPKYFSDVIEVIRVGTDFSWDTAATGAATKARNLPVQSKLPPSFVPLVAKWVKQGGVIEAPLVPVSKAEVKT